MLCGCCSPTVTYLLVSYPTCRDLPHQLQGGRGDPVLLWSAPSSRASPPFRWSFTLTALSACSSSRLQDRTRAGGAVSDALADSGDTLAAAAASAPATDEASQEAPWPRDDGVCAPFVCCPNCVDEFVTYGFVFVDEADPAESFFADRFVRRFSVPAIRRAVELYCGRPGVQRVEERYPAVGRFLRGPPDERTTFRRLRAIPGDQYAVFFRALCEDFFGPWTAPGHPAPRPAFDGREGGLAHVAGDASGTPAAGAGAQGSARCPACGTRWTSRSLRPPLPTTSPQEAAAIRSTSP